MVMKIATEDRPPKLFLSVAIAYAEDTAKEGLYDLYAVFVILNELG